MKNTVFLALGSNMGNKDSNIRRAVKAIGRNKACRILKQSSLYETRPYGYTKQENFLNGVIKVETDLDLDELFRFVKKIESEVGRQDRFKWGPREIDIDILLFNSEIRDTGEIRIPHKGMAERDFVLVPFSEIEPDLIHPEINQKISDICNTITESNIIKKL